MSKLNLILTGVIIVLVVVFGSVLYRFLYLTQERSGSPMNNQPVTAVPAGASQSAKEQKVTVKPIMRAFLQKRRAPVYAEIPAGQEVILMNQEMEPLPLEVSGLITETLELKPLGQKSYTPQKPGEIRFKATNGSDIQGTIIVK